MTRAGKTLEFRSIGGSGLIVPTPLYVDDALLSSIVLGEESNSWPTVRRAFDRQGMPARSAAVRGLYYLPAVLKFLDRREGLQPHYADFAEDGPDKFEPR